YSLVEVLPTTVTTQEAMTQSPRTQTPRGKPLEPAGPSVVSDSEFRTPGGRQPFYQHKRKSNIMT
ncbi:hypothetical protein SARC_03574, partial [Sphaeroforma arctica JP610]